MSSFYLLCWLVECVLAGVCVGAGARLSSECARLYNACARLCTVCVRARLLSALALARVECAGIGGQPPCKPAEPCEPDRT